MSDLAWLSQEAHRIHDWFCTLFYLLITVILLLGVFIEYFKWPLGGVPSFGPLVGRALVAAILLHTYPEVANTISDISDAVTNHLGGFVNVRKVLSLMGDKVDALTWSWTSVRQSVVMALSYLAFFLLFFTVHVAQALYLYAIVLLFIFSPILIALFVLPKTAGATGGLYRSLIEVSMWKPVWCVLATILWSSADAIQADTSQVNFLSAICFSLIAAGSLILTPILVHFLAEKGVSGMSASLAQVSVPGIAVITPGRVMGTGIGVGKRAFNSAASTVERVTKSRFPRVNKAIERVPRFRTSKKHPLMTTKTKDKKRKGQNEQ
jgi:hypothetical protein